MYIVGESQAGNQSSHIMVIGMFGTRSTTWGHHPLCATFSSPSTSFSVSLCSSSGIFLVAPTNITACKLQLLLPLQQQLSSPACKLKEGKCVGTHMLHRQCLPYATASSATFISATADTLAVSLTHHFSQLTRVGIRRKLKLSSPHTDYTLHKFTSLSITKSGGLWWIGTFEMTDVLPCCGIRKLGWLSWWLAGQEGLGFVRCWGSNSNRNQPLDVLIGGRLLLLPLLSSVDFVEVSSVKACCSGKHNITRNARSARSVSVMWLHLRWLTPELSAWIAKKWDWWITWLFAWDQKYSNTHFTSRVQTNASTCWDFPCSSQRATSDWCRPAVQQTQLYWCVTKLPIWHVWQKPKTTNDSRQISSGAWTLAHPYFTDLPHVSQTVTTLFHLKIATTDGNMYG